MHSIFSSEPLPSPPTPSRNLCLSRPHTPLSRSGFLRGQSTNGGAASDDPDTASTSPPRGEGRAHSSPATAPAPAGLDRARPRGGGLRAAGGSGRSSTPWEAAAPAQARVCALPSRADPAPRAPSRGVPPGRPVGAAGPSPRPAEAEARAASPGGGTRLPSATPPTLPPAAQSSPGSRVQSSRGAVREMQLRFLSTLLRMVPTPPPPPPPCRFRHLPPRLREPVSLSCRIREPRAPARPRPPGSPPPGGRSSCARGSARRLGRGSLRSSGSAAGARGWSGSAGTAGAAGRSAAGGHLQCGACTAEAGEGSGRGGRRAPPGGRAGDGGGAPAPNPGTTVRRRAAPAPAPSHPPPARGSRSSDSDCRPSLKIWEGWSGHHREQVSGAEHQRDASARLLL